MDITEEEKATLNVSTLSCSERNVRLSLRLDWRILIERTRIRHLERETVQLEGTQCNSRTSTCTRKSCKKK